MSIHFEDCDTLEECYEIQNNDLFINSQLEQLELLDIDNSTKLQASGRLLPSIEEEYVPSKEPNRVESLNIWKIHRYKTVKSFHLVICYAVNEKGKSHSTNIIIPSEFTNKKTYDVQKILAREIDNEIVEGDDLSIVFRYHNILYNSYKLNVRQAGPDNRCELDPAKINQEQYHHISVFDNNKSWQYTSVVELQFKNIIKDCSYNYSVELKVGSGEYFKGVTNSSTIYYSLNVLDSVKPYFLVSEALKSNKTVVHIGSNNASNSTDRYSMAYSGLF